MAFNKVAFNKAASNKEAFNKVAFHKLVFQKFADQKVLAYWLKVISHREELTFWKLLCTLSVNGFFGKHFDQSLLD